MRLSARVARRRLQLWLSCVLVSCAALAAVIVAEAPGRGSSVDPQWLAKSLAGAREPASVRNNVVRGALGRRDSATRAWKAQTARYRRALQAAKRQRGAQRRQALRAARRVKPDPQSKPQYVVVWAGHANAGDTSTRGAQSELGKLLADPAGFAGEARSKFVPGLDGFMVIDARRENADGTRNRDYGKVVNFASLPLPWGVETEAHHMQYEWQDGQPLLAGGLFNDTTFVLSLAKLPQLELLNTITPTDTPNGSVPDAYDYAGNGRFIGTYMGGPQSNYAGSPGEVVTFKPDPEKGLVVASETAAGVAGARQQGNPGGIPEPCSSDEAAPLDTCANPHGIQVRPDLNRMITSDYGEPKMVVIDPVKPNGGTFFRPTVRIWDTTSPDQPKLISVAHMPTGWRAPTANSMQANRGIMENAKTWPVTSRYPKTLPSRGAFAGAMCGGGIFFTPDVTALRGDSSRQWPQVWDDGISLLAARDGDVEDFIRDPGTCEGGAWMQVTRDNRWLFRAVGGNAPNQDNLSSNGQSHKIIYNIDVEPLIRSAQDGKVACDLTRGIDTNGDRRVDIAPDDVVRKLANGEAVADCPRLIDTINVHDTTTGGPHWGAIDNHSLTTDGTPTRLAISNYFVARSGVDGNHRLYMIDVDPDTGQLTYDRTFRDENTNELGVNFNRPDWPGNPDAGYYKPHSMIWACPPGICPADTTPTTQDPNPTTTTDPTTFNGTCNLTGRGEFRKPYHLTMENNAYMATATGTCTGTVAGKAYDGPAHLVIDGRMNRPMSCELGISGQVPGTLTFGDPADLDARQLRVQFDAPRVGAQQPFTVTGAYNGLGHGNVQWKLPGGVETIEACATGEGVSGLDFDLTLQTVKELYG